MKLSPTSGEVWESKETGLAVKIIKADEDAVWWENLDVWSFPCNTQTAIFVKAMKLSPIAGVTKMQQPTKCVATTTGNKNEVTLNLSRTATSQTNTSSSDGKFCKCGRVATAMLRRVFDGEIVGYYCREHILRK